MACSDDKILRQTQSRLPEHHMLYGASPSGSCHVFDTASFLSASAIAFLGNAMTVWHILVFRQAGLIKAQDVPSDN